MRAEAGRVLGIALELRRPAHVVFGQERHAEAALRHRGRVEQRPARDDLFRLPDVRDDLLVRLPGAGADAGERERGAHQLQELPAAGRIVELRGLRRELPLDVLAELRRVGQLFEAAPVGAAFEAGQSRADVGEVHRVSQQLRGSLCPRCGLSPRSPVADRAARHVLDAGHVVFLLQPQAQLALAPSSGRHW